MGRACARCENGHFQRLRTVRSPHPPISPPARDTQLAFEVLVRGDQAAGRACVIPLALFVELASNAAVCVKVLR